MTTEPRWTQATEDALTQMLAAERLVSTTDCWTNRTAARAVLDWAADRGLLVEPGGRLDMDWGVQSPGYQAELRTASQATSEAEARTWAADTPVVKLVRRTVHTGPWREAQP